MNQQSEKIFFGVFLFLITANLLFLDFVSFRKKTALNQPLLSITPTPILESQCLDECQKIIDQKISEALAKIPTQKPEKTMSVIVPTSAPATQAKAIYIPLVTEGTTVSTSWVDIVPSEFYFNLADYPGATQVRFICYLQALHGSAKVYARLYDQTNKRAVDYSQLETQNDSYTLLESSGITIWRGNNQYTVQLKSENGTQVLLKEAKLKIIF